MYVHKVGLYAVCVPVHIGVEVCPFFYVCLSCSSCACISLHLIEHVCCLMLTFNNMYCNISKRNFH